MNENQESKLSKLAREKFGKLNCAEEKLFGSLAKNEPADYRTESEEDNDPKNAPSWGEDRTLRADRIQWLCIESEAWKLCLPQGVNILGAKIEESLNLSFTEVYIPLRFSQCYFTQVLRLQQADLRRLDLGGTHIAPSEISLTPTDPENRDALMAARIKVTGDVFLNKGFQALGTVNLLGATIGASLDCDQGSFTNKNKYALLAASIKVTGDVFLSEGFQALGSVILQGATIGASLDCDQGSFTKGMLLDLQFAKVQTFVHAKNSLPSPGNLEINGFVYEALQLEDESLEKISERYLKWLRLQSKSSFASQPYEQLAKVLRSTGNSDEAMRVLIEKEKDLLQYGNLNWFSKFWKRVLGITITYGYQPQKAFLFALGIVVLNSFIFKSGYQAGLITPTEKDCQSPISQQQKYCSNYPEFNPFIYSLDIFLPIIDLRLKNYWLPNANVGVKDKFLHIKSGAWLRYYLMLHIISGWVLTTLWVAGFSGIVRSNNKQ